MSLRVPLHDPDFYRGDPYPTFKRMRSEAPVYWHEERGWWALTRHEDIKWVSTHPLVFSSAQGIMIPEGGGEVGPERVDALIFTDPPRHRKLRNLIRQGFTPRAVRRLEPRFREITRDILAGIEPGKVMDFSEEVAGPFPTLVIAELLGVPTEDWPKFRHWSDAIIGFLDPDETLDPDEAQARMHEYLMAVIDERRRAPRQDLISTLLAAEVDGEHLSSHELYSFCWLFLVAGNETTRNLISLGTLALLQHPDQRKLLCDDPTRIPGAIEEMLRWCSPVTHMVRTATRDVELRRCRIREGQKVVMLYAAANRDEDVFGPNAEEFNITRDPNPHLDFGIGEHVCVGASLARLEARVLFEGLLPLLPGLELAGPISRVAATMVPGIKHMPVRFGGTPA